MLSRHFGKLFKLGGEKGRKRGKKINQKNNINREY